MKQITIIAESRPGVVAELTEALAASDINIETLDAESIENAGVILLTVDKYDEALQVLSRFPDIKAISEDTILIKLDDKPGALARIARRFKDAQINMRSIRIVQKLPGEAVVAICAERTEDALRLVEDVILH